MFLPMWAIVLGVIVLVAAASGGVEFDFSFSRLWEDTQNLALALTALVVFLAAVAFVGWFCFIVGQSVVVHLASAR